MRSHPSFIAILVFLTPSLVIAGQAPCPADLDGDVDAADLAELPASWGPYSEYRDDGFKHLRFAFASSTYEHQILTSMLQHVEAAMNDHSAYKAPAPREKDENGVERSGEDLLPPTKVQYAGDGGDCDTLGDNSSNFTFNGPRIRGNGYTFDNAQTISSISQEFDFAGAATLYFYVVESNIADGPYNVISETLVDANGVGQGFYSSGPILVSVTPGNFYGIFTAWATENITFFLRENADNPTAFPHGQVLGSFSDNAPTIPVTSPYTPPFQTPSLTYSQVLCFGVSDPCDGVDCSDLDDECNVGVCNPADGMCEQQPTNEGGPCEDGDACTDNDMCSGGSCQSGGPTDCDDEDACTDDGCDPDTGCTHGDVDCDDGDPCTDESCDPETGCGHTDVDCDDGESCTADSCDPETGCVHEDIEQTLIIKQGAGGPGPDCHAPVNASSNGLLPILLVGTGGFDVHDVDQGSLDLHLCGEGPSGVQPIAHHTRFRDLNHPTDLPIGCPGCQCNDDESSDGIDDLSMKFSTNDVVATLGLTHGVYTLELTGTTQDGWDFCARDCIIVIPPGFGLNNATMSKESK